MADFSLIMAVHVYAFAAFGAPYNTSRLKHEYLRNETKGKHHYKLRSVLYITAKFGEDWPPKS